MEVEMEGKNGHILNNSFLWCWILSIPYWPLLAARRSYKLFVVTETSEKYNEKSLIIYLSVFILNKYN